MFTIKKIHLALALSVGCLIACDDDNDTVTIENARDAVLKDLSQNVIVATYRDLDDAANALKASIEALEDDATNEHLQDAREKWIATRIPWEASEGFLYGPADTESLDPALDSWPVDVNAMEEVVNSNEEITPERLPRNDDARGFHLIEYLIWELDGNAQAGDLTARELEYLVAADLTLNTEKLYTAWRPEGGNYVDNFVNAESGILQNRILAIEEMAKGITAICDEVANAKIADPLNSGGDPKPEEEESRFSNNSIADFRNNLQSVKNIYEGLYRGASIGDGLTTLTVRKDKALDDKIKLQIAAAIKSLDDVPGTFTQAIFENKPALQKAIEEINKLQTMLEEELVPLLKNL